MNYKEKYCAESEKSNPENLGKKAISDEAFAFIEVIDAKLEELRITWLRKGR